jgi:lipid-binding SYLF domain-containing protein
MHGASRETLQKKGPGIGDGQILARSSSNTKEATPMRTVIGAMTMTIVMAATTASTADLSQKTADRIKEAAATLSEIHAVPDKDIPQELWDKAACVIVVPNLKKAAFIVGGEFGKGLMSCRQNGGWSAPIFMEMEKGSWGLQIGAESVDLVLLAMNPGGVRKLLGNKVSLGADASVAGGPVGRSAHAATDAQLKAEILSWSRAQGLFAGIDISGGVLKPDADDNAALYGKNVSAEEVVLGGKTKAPAATQAFMQALRRQ